MSGNFINDSLRCEIRAQKGEKIKIKRPSRFAQEHDQSSFFSLDQGFDQSQTHLSRNQSNASGLSRQMHLQDVKTISQPNESKNNIDTFQSQRKKK